MNITYSNDNTTLYRGDDTDAFGGNFIRVNIKNNTTYKITKCVWSCGTVKKTYDNPIFPLIINLTSDETSKLLSQNTCYLAVYDEYGRKKTCKGKLTFDSNSKKV